MNIPRLALLAIGAVLLLAYCVATFFVLYALVGGDCFPELAGPCPTAKQTRMTILRILISAAVGLVALVVGCRKLDRRLTARRIEKRN